MKAADTPIVLETPRFSVEGKSRAGNETYFRIRQLDLAFDIGRCPDLLIPVPHIFLSHAHLDHALGVPLYAAQRGLRGMKAGSVYVPAPSLSAFQELMRLHGQMEQCRYDLQLIGMEHGQQLELRRNLLVRAHPASHRVASNAYEVVERRRKLRPEFMGLTPEELGSRSREGVDLTEPAEESLLFYTGDTDSSIFESSAALFRSRLLICECSFTASGDEERARRYQHLHFDDLCRVADRFENACILLVHFSLRDSPEEIHRQVSLRCPPRLRERIRLGLPEPFMRL